MLGRNGAARNSACTEIEGRKIVSTGKRDASPSKPSTNCPQARRLYCGDTCAALCVVEPDARFSGMWRVLWPDGQLSDMANLSRAKDAAAAICERGPPRRDPRLFRWRKDAHGTPANRGYAQLNCWGAPS